MQFWSAASLESDPADIVADLNDQLPQRASAYDLLIAFTRPPPEAPPEDVIRAVRGALPAGRFLACTAESVIGSGHEIEGRPATAILAAALPDVHIEPLPLDTHPTTGLPVMADDERDPTLANGEDGPIEAFIVLLDPFSVQVDQVLEQLSAWAPDAPVIGGVASWGSSAGTNRLAQDDAIRTAGLVGVTLRGNVDLGIIVSQGCRPIGQPLSVTGSNRQFITELEGRSPIECLREAFESADEETQTAMRTGGVLLGRGVSREPGDLGRGAFLIRTLLGADQQSGALAVGDLLERGDVVQFHVRDAGTAREDLEMLLTPQAFEDQAAGALLFTCNGRGSRMYGYPDGDISVVRTALGEDVPVAGFFCGGELGPIGGTNFIHGFTASMAVFRPKH